MPEIGVVEMWYIAGLLKTGTKTLYISNQDGILKQTETLCLLDFYVDEKHQRKGYGFKMFEFMLNVSS